MKKQKIILICLSAVLFILALLSYGAVLNFAKVPVDDGGFYKVEISRTNRNSQGETEMENLVDFLKNGITEQMSLEDIVDVFEQMCNIPLEVEDDMILFETGTFAFEEERFFLFSLVRQFPDDDDEYYQIHLDISYEPTIENKTFEDATWNEEISGDFFDYIKNSQAFDYAKNHEYVKVEIYIDET